MLLNCVYYYQIKGKRYFLTHINLKIAINGIKIKTNAYNIGIFVRFYCYLYKILIIYIITFDKKSFQACQSLKWQV